MQRRLGIVRVSYRGVMRRRLDHFGVRLGLLGYGAHRGDKRIKSQLALCLGGLCPKRIEEE